VVMDRSSHMCNRNQCVIIENYDIYSMCNGWLFLIFSLNPILILLRCLSIRVCFKCVFSSFYVCLLHEEISGTF